MPRTDPARQTVLAASAEAERRPLETVDLDAPLSPELAFEPFERHAKCKGVFDAVRQRRFIAALAACGSVTTSAAAVGMSIGQMYTCRNRAGAESFAAAWDKAVERGARRVLDVLIDQAINGTPEYFYKDGQIVGERRHFNTRAMMWIVAHNFPEKYGVSGELMHSNGSPLGLKRLKEQWRKEWAEETRHKADPDKARAKLLKLVLAIKRAREDGRLPPPGAPPSGKDA